MGTQIRVINVGFNEMGNIDYKVEPLAYAQETPISILDFAVCDRLPVVGYKRVGFKLTELPGIIIGQADNDKLTCGLGINSCYNQLPMEELLRDHPFWNGKKVFLPKITKKVLYKTLRESVAATLTDQRNTRLPKDYLDTRESHGINPYLEEMLQNYLEILGVITNWPVTGRRNDVTIEDLKRVLSGRIPKSK